MVETSNQFKISIREPARKITGRIVFSGFEYDKRFVQNINIDTILSPDDFYIGIAPMTMASVELDEDQWEGLYVDGDLTGKVCRLELGLALPGGLTEYVSMGVFTVESSERQQTKVKLKLVDNMHLMEREYNPNLNITTNGIPYWLLGSMTYSQVESMTYEQLESGLYNIMQAPQYPSTLKDIALHAAYQSGLRLVTETWPNSDYVVNSIPVYEGITCRQVLAQVAELAGGYAVINRTGSLEIKRLGTQVSTSLSDEDLFAYIEHQGNDGRIDRVIVKVGEEQSSQGSGDNLYTVVDNIFVQNPANVVGALYSALQGVSYQPIESIEWSGDFSLDAGDKINVKGKETYILNRSIKVAGGLRETFGAPIKSNVERNSTGKNNTILEINRIKTTIRIVSGEIDQIISDSQGNFSQIYQSIGEITSRVEDAEGNLSSVTQTVNGIGSRVSSVESEVSDIGETVTNHTTDINQLADEVSTKVTATYVDNAINSVNQRGLNLVSNKPENWQQEDTDTISTIDRYGVPVGGKLTIHSGSGFEAEIMLYYYDYAHQLISSSTWLQLQGIDFAPAVQTPFGTHSIRVEITSQTGLSVDDMKSILLKIEAGEVATSFSNYPPDEGIDLSEVYTRIEQVELVLQPDSIKSLVEESVVQGGSTVISTKSEVTQTKDEIEMKFSSQGGKNLLQNSGFQDGLNLWSQRNDSGSIVAASEYPDMPSGAAVRLALNANSTNSVSQNVNGGFNRNNKKWTVSAYVRNTATSSGTNNPYAGLQLVVYYTDNSTQYFTLYNDRFNFNYYWEKFTTTITTNANKEVESFRFDVIARDMIGGIFFVSSIVFEEGEVAHTWSLSNNESYTTSHRFNRNGYELRDSNGSALITPNGVANEQNIGRVDNIEAGYPMRIPFNIGAEVSVINQVILKWEISKFRTYSKGAASGGGTKTTPSGGGSTSGPSSRNTADNSAPSTFFTNTQTELSFPNEGKHYHQITSSQMSHSHGMAHTHTTPAHTHTIDINHSHSPVFGILETGVSSNTAYVHVDGVHRATISATRSQVDLSSWVTTNGWHVIEILTPSGSIKRIDANVYIKTYIRR